MANFRELLNKAKSEIREVTTAEAEDQRASGSLILDVREADEFEQGAVPGGVFIPRGHLEAQVEGRIGDKTTPIIVMCAGGVRSAFAARTLGELGYTDVSSMAGGFNKWKDEGRDWSTPAVLSPEQRNRYQRHLLVPEVGEEGQQKLLGAKVLLLGAGGLGSPAALYLAAAGVGTIGIIDMDVVDASNLQRQILHIEGIIAGYDVIVDGADNFPVRYMLNDASVKAGIPVVHGSIFRFEGQVTVFDPRNGPTYRDMLPEPPPAEMAPSCAEAGVLGALPGIIGTIQAVEAIKLILGIGDSLVGRYLTFDALDMSFREYKIRRDPANEITWENRDRIEVVELEGHCMPAPLVAPAR